MKRLLEDCKKLISAKSVSPHGTEEAAQVAASLMRDLGLEVRLQQVSHCIEEFSKRQFNAIGILGDPLVDKKVRKGLLLLTHLDTAFPGERQLWDKTGGYPHRCVHEGDRLYGLGAADAKLDFLAKLYALAKFREQKLSMPVYLVGSCGESIGMLGTKYLIQSWALNPKYVLIGKPTGLKLVRAHKSFHIYRLKLGYQTIERSARGFNRRLSLVSYGRTVDGSSPAGGVHAIHQLVDFMNRAGEDGFDMRLTRLESENAVNQVPDNARVEIYLTSHQLEDFKRYFHQSQQSHATPPFKMEVGGLGDVGISFLPEALFPCFKSLLEFLKEIRLDSEEDPDFEVPRSLLNVTRVRHSLDRTEIDFELYLLPKTSLEQAHQRLTMGIQGIAGQHTDLNVTLECIQRNAALDVDPKNPWMVQCQEVLKTVGLHSKTEKRSFCSEASRFAEKGYDVAVFGPGGSDSNIRAPNEHMLMSELSQARLFYEGIIERLCL